MQSWNTEFFKSQFEKIIILYEKSHAAKVSRLVSEFEIWKETSAPEGVVIYGAGGMGRVVHGFLGKLGVKVKAFIDANQNKHGDVLLGCPILSVGDAGKVFKEYPCVIAINMPERCHDFFSIAGILCSEGGFARVLHHQFLRQYMSIAGYTILENYVLHPAEDVIASHRDILHVSEILHDDLSREALYKIIRSRLIDPNIPVDSWQSARGIYFREDLFRILPDEVVIDGGAYNGDTLAAFYSLYHDKLKEWHAYEPLPDNIEAIRLMNDAFAEDFRKSVFIHRGVLGNRTGAPAVFITNNLGSHGGKVIGSEEEGFGTSLGIPSDIISVPILRIDDEEYANRSTFIKLDVEGAEEDALKGAEQTVRNAMPLVAASIYHKSKDLWTLPLLLFDYLPANRFMIRCDQPIYDTVLYAIPRNRWL